MNFFFFFFGTFLIQLQNINYKSTLTLRVVVNWSITENTYGVCLGLSVTCGENVEKWRGYAVYADGV